MIVLRKTPNIVGLASVILCLSVIASAQQSHLRRPTGTIKGVTIDFLGVRVPNANVVFEGAQINRKVVSNQAGEFEIELPAGEYRVTVSQFGIFDPFERKKLKVRAARVKKFDVILRYDTKKHPPVT